MINREWQLVDVLTYSSELDKYGQKRQGTPTIRNVDMVVKIYSQHNVDDVKYVDVDMIGLTKDRSITTENVIRIGSDKYNVKYVIPSGRYTQILMYKVK